VPSANCVLRSATARIVCTATALLVSAGLLAGCTTTQHEAQRMQLDSARERAAVLATKVTSANPLVSANVTAGVAGTVAGRLETALIVTVHNAGHRAVTDLPISVGYSLPGKPRVYLNAAAGLYYFEAHLPAVFSGQSRVWVYTANGALPKGAHLFALVGRGPSVPALLTEPNVRIGLKLAASTGGKLHIGLENSTSVPQYQLQVYAYAKRAGRYVAAGNETVTDLGAGSRQDLTLTLVGTTRGATVQVEAIPTILQ
jgi:hypothetical protein